ncbi:putative TPR-repeat protein [Leptomonas pyrrhocoris]|uniref:RNA polymerase II-associated protein 3 n=1 Tax=Leptomonas pyrrhocoris TaxID=157538 RepID=A0A0M9G7U6_LEPPY|nr:putative TPR-repeat protein [Leptomonas pyrrhocoris]KPA84196.1 putative TPR-repeat protein [Leptomonas pyrrhocoris]|eukprot:XP_015662635.1 putative TPR-repeat protein [Leptomonas pyrrhocoris]
MDRGVAEAIRQQSEDLSEELKELEQWEDAVKAKEAARAQRKATQAVEAATVVPPIRGTVPSLKEAVRQQQTLNNSSSNSAKAAADPIQEAKERGNAFFQAGRLQEAVAAYTVGIDLDPASSTTHVLYANRAMCYIKMGQWSAAEKDATTCVQMNTGYAKAYYRRAIARKNLHKLKEARTDLEAVLALSPKDATAQQEMVEVTKAIQAERAAAAASAPAANSAKKRIVIEEVDSEDDEAVDGADSVPASIKPDISAGEQQLRQARIDEDMKKLAAARAQHESQTRLEAQREAAAQAQRQRRNQRVEIIEEDEEETSKEASAGPLPTSPPAKSTPAPPAAPVQHTKTTAAAAPTPAASPVAPRPRPAVTKESLTTPKSFTEFERRFREVEQMPELRNHYVSLLHPAGLSKLFGSNMTPEILVGVLESIKTFNGTTALQFAKGICQVNRVEDMTLFFNSKEKAVVQEVLDLLKSSGGSEKEIQSIQRKLKPF